MKFTTTLIFLCFTLFASAQFPNLVDTTIDGQVINLQEDYLDQGKPVVIHFFGAWNPWDRFFLDTGAVQAIYDVFGPDGTDQIGIIGYEIDPFSTDENVMGIGADFFYNFTEKMNYPIINPDSVHYANLMNVFAVPSLIMYCPDGNIYVDGQTNLGPDSFPVIYDENMFYSNFLTTDDIITVFESTCGVQLEAQGATGYITLDTTELCSYDISMGIPNSLIHFNNGTKTYVRSTNGDGQYDALLPDGNYDISYESWSSLLEVCEQTDNVVVDQNITNDVSAIFQGDTICPEIDLSLAPWLLRPCDRNSVLHASICNKGIAAVYDNEYELHFPPNSQIIDHDINDSYSYDSLTGVLSFHIDTLDIFACQEIHIAFHTPCETALNDTLCFSLQSIAQLIDPACTAYVETDVETCNVVIGSYDPNDKRGMTKGKGEANYIKEGSRLEYMIRFQNTGNDTAFTVRIEDQLPPELIGSTIRPIMASHDYEMRLDDQLLEFTFKDIRLVDSFTNEPLSHGFVLFAVDSREDLSPGTAIDNTASIYFDSNEPVITNTFRYTTNLPSHTVNSESLHYTLFPNPANDRVKLLYRGEVSQNLQYGIYDLMGRQIKAGKYHGDWISLSELSTGSYWIKLSDRETKASYTEKLVIVKQ